MKKQCILFLIVLGVFLESTVSVNAMTSLYYDQLNSEQKRVYKEMLDHFYGAEEVNYFSEINETYPGIPMENAILNHKNNALIAYSALVNDYPDLYWSKQINLSFTGGNLMSDSGLVSSTIYGIQFGIDTDGTIHNQSLYEKKILKALRSINKKIKKRKSEYQRIVAIHDYLCKNTKYENKYALNNDSKYHYLHTAYGVFVKGKAACDGYSMAFKELCDYYKIPCMIVYGRAKNKYGAYENHAWNVVKFKKKWYAVDVTWDDSSKSKKWFLCGKKTLKKTHMEISNHADVLQWGAFSFPKLNRKSYKK